MGVGHQYEIEAMRDKKKNIHPAWAAIGCFSIVGLTLAGYFLGDLFIRADSKAGWIPLPEELAWPSQNPYLIIKMGIAFIVLLIGSAIFSIVYVLINPPKPGKYDVSDPSIFPPPPRRIK